MVPVYIISNVSVIHRRLFFMKPYYAETKTRLVGLGGYTVFSATPVRNVVRTLHKHIYSSIRAKPPTTDEMDQTLWKLVQFDSPSGKRED